MRSTRLALSFALAAMLVACERHAAGAAGAAPAAARTAATRPPAVADASIADVLAWLERGETTSAALVRAYLDRIEAYDRDREGRPGLAAIITVSPDALAQARTLDAERAAGHLRGPLHGVPIVIKDNIATADMPTTQGAVAFAEYRPHRDATVVRRLREAGAIVIAKASLSEFAWTSTSSESGLRGQARNPYDLQRTTTGSSGGTAAAVAAGFAPAGLGTDTSGSIRNPSVHQALVGLRPTHGLVSLAGVTAQVAPMDTVGPMTRTVADAALLLDLMAGTDARDPYTAEADARRPGSYAASLNDTALHGRRIGVVANASYWGEDRDYGSHEQTRRQVVALVRQAVTELERQGATVVEVQLPDRIPGRAWRYVRHWMDASLASEQAAWPQGLAALTPPADRLTVSDYLEDGRAIGDIRDYGEALLAQPEPATADLAADDALRAQGLSLLHALFERHRIDALVTPTDTLTALPLEDLDAHRNGNLSLASGLGLPAVTVPAGFAADGLPAGLQLIGLPYSEAALLAMAYDYEQATRHRRAPASTPALGAGAAPLAGTAAGADPL